MFLSILVLIHLYSRNSLLIHLYSRSSNSSAKLAPTVPMTYSADRGYHYRYVLKWRGMSFGSTPAHLVNQNNIHIHIEGLRQECLSIRLHASAHIKDEIMCLYESICIDSSTKVSSIVIDFFYWRKKKLSQKWRRWKQLEGLADHMNSLLYFPLQKFKRIICCVIYMYMYNIHTYTNIQIYVYVYIYI